MKKTLFILSLIIIIAIIIFIANIFIHNSSNNDVDDGLNTINNISNMKIISPAFENNEMIPSEYTCDGENISPELRIIQVPENAKTLALIVDDPDAPSGEWVHWIVFNIPLSKREIVITKSTSPKGINGKNDFNTLNYGGPCPPSGTHRYFFKLYALDIELDLPEGATKQEIVDKMQGHVIEKAELIGKYKR